MIQPKVSVVISAYDACETISECIESVINQTFDQWEVIVIDDASNDNTADIVQTYIANYPNKIKFFKNKINIGPYASANLGIVRSKGDYIARLDSDDLCKKDRLQKQYDFLKKNRDIALVSGAIEYIDEKGVTFGRTYPVISHSKIKKKMIREGNVIPQPAVMMRRDAFIACGGYYEKLTAGFDYHMWLKFLRNGYKLCMLPEPMISYRVHGNAISNRKKTQEQVRLMKVILEYDNPPQELIDAFRSEVKNTEGQFISSQSRKTQIENSMHCKIWRMSRRLRLPEKMVETFVCGVQNMLA